MPKSGLVEGLGIGMTPRNLIEIDGNFSTSRKGVFACGDCVSGPSLVVRAISSGRNLASRVDRYLKSIIKP